MLAVEQAPQWPLAVYAGLVVVMTAGMVGLSHILGERSKRQPEPQIPYESGILPTGNARLRMTAKFYLIAMFFVIFDLEAVFVFAWVIAFGELGWGGYATMSLFIALLMAALAYLWRQGALDWGVPRGKGSRDTSEDR